MMTLAFQQAMERKQSPEMHPTCIVNLVRQGDM
jgi:hypothetical protein